MLQQLRKRKLKQSLLKAIVHSQPSWSEIQLIAKTKGLPTAAAFTIIKEIFYRNLMTGKKHELSAHKDLLKSYLDQYLNDHPCARYDELPESISTYLAQLEQNLSEHEMLEQLASQIRKTLANQSQQNFRMKVFAVAGFVIGVAGLAFAIYPYLLS